MAKCKNCGKSGLFFRVNTDGFCKECERIEKLKLEETSLKKEIENLHNEHTELNASYQTLRENKEVLYNEIAEKAKNDIKNEYDETCKKTVEMQNNILQLQTEIGKQEKTITNNANKLLHIKKLLDSTQYSAKRVFLYETIPDGMIDKTTMAEAEELLSTTVKLKFNLMDVRELRKRFTQNDKVIKELLSKYQSRYTTKANMSIYRLMVIALEAELQNIIFNLKYSKLDKAINDIKSMTAKYQKIAAEGNQNIAPTVARFIGEIEYLFIEAVNIEYEYYIQKERIREEQKEIRAKIRQEAAERKRLEEERKKVEKEEEKFKNELAEIERLITEEKDRVKIKKLEERRDNRIEELKNIEKKKDDISKLEHGFAGHVYIISNLGSFGDGVFKIGMTRRLDPMERVDELGDASVPFKFDVHSLIFSEHAPELELKLHKQLHNRRVNKINLRREFFRVTLDELEELVYSIEPTAQFNKTMLAEQYYQSMAVNEVPESVELIEEGNIDEEEVNE